MRKFWPVLILALFIFVIFRQSFLHGDSPIPADILTGGYYPWLDSNWGYPVHVPIKNNLPSDVISLLYPWRILGINYIKAGFIPLWDDTILLGVPLLANFQAAILNPLNFLFFLLPDVKAWSLQVILQPILSFVGMYLFLKNLKLSKMAATLGGLLYSFSGFSLVWLEYNSIIYTVAYVPFLFLLADKIVQEGKFKYAFFLAFVLFFQLVSGYPLTTIFSLVFLSFYFVWRVSKNRLGLVKISLFILGIISGIGFAAIQLVPGAEITALSIRAFDHSAQAGDIKYLPLAHLISFFIPDFFGNPGTANYWGIGSFDNFAFFIASSGVYLFILSFISRIAFKRSNFIFILFIILGLLYATNNPISNIISQQEFLGLNSSVNTRVLFIVIFATSTLSAVSFDYLNSKKLTLLQKAFPLLLYLAILAGWAISYYKLKMLGAQLGQFDSLGNKSKDLIEVLALAKEDLSINISQYNIAFRNIAIPTAIVALSFLLTLVRIRLFLFAVLLILTLYSIKVSSDKYLSFTREDLVFANMLALEQLKSFSQNHRFEREKAELLPANVWSAYNLRSPSGQNVFVPLTTARYLNLVNTGSLNDELLTRFVQMENPNSPLYDTLDISHYAALNHDVKSSIPSKDGRPYPWKIPARFRDIANIGTIRIYENTTNLGPGWFPQEVICESNLQRAADILIGKNYNPAKTAVIECESSQNMNTQGTVRKINQEPNKVEYQVSVPDNSWLVISQAIYPGWKAFAKGRELEIKPVNIALTGVYVPKGDYQLELKYDPQSFKTGLYITLASFAGWVVAAVARKKFIN